RVIEGFVSCFQAGVAAAEESAHVGRDQRIRKAVKCGLTFHVAQVKRAGGVQVNNATIAGDCTDARVPRRIIEGAEFHRSAGMSLIERRKILNRQSFLTHAEEASWR